MISFRLAQPLGRPWPIHPGRYGCYGRYASLRRCIGSERGLAFVDERRPKRPQARNFSGGAVESSTEEVIQPGAHVFEFCKKYQVSFPSVLRRAQGVQLTPNPLLIGIMVSERHCFTKNVMKYLDKYEQAFTKTIFDIYIAKKQKPLWYSVFSVPITTPLPCREGARRLRHAFRDSLAARGYDRDGRKTTADDSIMDLHGTVHLVCGDPKVACNVKFAELVKHTDKIVAGIERILARGKDGRFINAAQKNKGQPAKSAWRSMDRNKAKTQKRGWSK
ncbi:hypothetical protein K445DRAFT_322514 [Daldinia sp. EC12]|nr:hypothetical protein K445DRAFT_322514 [Daldinia sp. EC12]